jgi:hypothetical protein
MKRPTISFAFSIAILALMNGPARAEAILAPNQNTPTQGAALTTGNIESTGTYVTGLTYTNVGTSIGGSFTLKEDVYRTLAGTYDFLFQVTNTGSTNISDLSVVNYGPTATNFSTDVGYQTVGPGGDSTNSGGMVGGAVATPTITRSPAGGTIDFTFDSTAVLPPNSISNVLFIQTNATNFDELGSGTINDNSLLNGTATVALFEPAAVPEPSSLVLCGLAGMVGLGHAARRRMRAR